MQESGHDDAHLNEDTIRAGIEVRKTDVDEVVGNLRAQLPSRVKNVRVRVGHGYGGIRFGRGRTQ